MKKNTTVDEQEVLQAGTPLIGGESVTDYSKVKPVDRKTEEYRKARDKEKVRGKFINHENAGGRLDFVFRIPYRGEPVEKYEMTDGNIYEIPRAVARHLNKNVWYPVHSYALDENGKPRMGVGQKVRRFSFQSLEFWDEDDLGVNDKKVIEVRHI